jgi:hypothetical protein
MSTLSKALAMLAAFLAGVVFALVAVGVYVSLTYKCSSGPCDAGGMTGFALWLLAGPLVGAAFAYGANRYIARLERRRHDA